MTQENQGRYTCTPYNVHGTAGSSAIMEVLVREPPTFVTRPKPIYQHKIDDDVQMACEAQGTPSPRVTWRRVLQFLSLKIEDPLWFSFTNWMDRWTDGLCLVTVPGRNLAY